jgi:outer membrane protein assembly factor BamB
MEKRATGAPGRCRTVRKLVLGAVLAVLLISGSIQAAEGTTTAETLLSFGGLRPGLCVHLDPGDGELPAELALAGDYHVHGLTTDRNSLASIRQYIASRGLYGQVVVDHSPLDRLPYPRNLANVLVVEDFAALREQGLTLEEIMRVVAPGSSALVGNAPADLKQMLAEAGYKDALINQKGAWTQVIKPRPEGMDSWPQPDHDAGRSSISGDRLVGPPNSVQWIAGAPWRHESSPKAVLSVDGRMFSSYADRGVVARDAFNGSELWRREDATALIASEDRLFARLTEAEALIALDARTGKTIRRYDLGDSEKSRAPRARLAYRDGVLLLGTVEVVKAYDADSGEELWRRRAASKTYLSLSPRARFRLVNQKRIIAEGKVFLTLPEAEVFLCLDLHTGEELWRVASRGDSLECYRQGILFSQYSGSNREKEVFNAAYSPEDGKLLWRYDYSRVGHGGNPRNIFLLDGLAWVHVAVPPDEEAGGKGSQVWHGLNPKTGEVVRRAEWKKTKHRCYGDRATEKYIMSGGMDFLEVGSGEHHKFLGGRGNCASGYMPANGLVYQAPNVCKCYSQVRGAVAFSADASYPGDASQEAGVRQAGEGKPADEAPSPDDWPMLRHDPARSGSTEAVLPSDLEPVWQTEIDGRLSSPVFACGKVFVSSVDDHRVIALDAATGKQVWSYRANGRVDSPPTIYAGRAVFGCRDGYLYCVSSATGQLIWSLQAAPQRRWLACRGQVESAWPLHGSVLIDNDTAYFAAGRHSDVDGGVLLHAAGLKTGEVLWRKRLDVNSLPPGYMNPGNVSNDILVSYGETFSMDTARFDSQTGALTGRWKLSTRGVSGFFWGGSAGGFLADMVQPIKGWHEQNWRQQWLSSELGWAHLTRGLILTSAGTTVFGIRLAGNRQKAWKDSSHDYEIFSCSRRDGPRHNTFWQTALPTGALPKAMIHAGSKVYVAVSGANGEPGEGAVLIYDAEDGRSLGEIPLDARPRFDGLAAVNGALVVVGRGGQVICLAKD